MKYLIIVAMLCLMPIMVLAANYIGESSIDWVFKTTMEDNFIQVNLTEVEDELINVKITQKLSLPPNYEFSIALCNVTSFNFTIKGKEFPYVRLAEHGYPNWCSQSNNYGFLTHFKIPKSFLPLDMNITIPKKIMKILPHFYLYAGNSTVIIDATAVATATRNTANRKIARTSWGDLYVGYRGINELSENSLYLGFLNKTSGNWTKTLVRNFSVDHVNLIIDYNSNFFLFYDAANIYPPRVMIINSTDNTTTWSNQTQIFSCGGGCHRSAGILDKNNVKHFCMIEVPDASGIRAIWYANDSSYGNEKRISNITYNYQYCDIGVDSNENICIIGIADSFSSIGTDLHSYCSTDNWTMRTIQKNIFVPIMVPSYEEYAPSITVDNDNMFLVGFASKHLSNTTSQCFVANFTANNLSSFTITQASNGLCYFPIISVSSQKDIHLIYTNQTTNTAVSTLWHSYKSWNETLYYNESLGAIGGYPSIHDSRYPHWNRMTNTLRYVYTNASGYVFFENKSIIYPSCFPEPNSNWNIKLEDNCINAVERNINGFNVSITGGGWFTTLAKIFNVSYLEIKSNMWNMTCKGGCFWI